MSVRRLPGNAGYVIRWLPYGWGGPYCQKTLPGATFAEAKREYAAKMAAAGRRTSHRARVKELWLRYAAVELTKRSESWRGHVTGIFEQKFLPRFGELYADQLSAAHLVRYRHERELDHLWGDARFPLVKAATVDKEVKAFLALLNFSESEGLVERNPVLSRGLWKDRRPPGVKNFFTLDEWTRFVVAFDDERAWAAYIKKVRRLGPVVVNPETGSERRHGGGRLPGSKAAEEHRARLAAAVPLFRWLLVSGSRLGEALKLTWRSVDLAHGVVTIPQSKTGREKTLPLSTEARRLLTVQGRGLPDALVFPRPSGGVWDHAKLWKTFKLALSLAGGRRELRIHDLRHTAGSWLAQEGFSEAVISEVLGHARSGVTAGYVHLRPEHLRAAVERLGELAGNVAGADEITAKERAAQ